MGRSRRGTATAELTRADVPEAVELARLAEPGPFLDRTPSLGSFFGVREAGRLIAMAGERFRTDRTVEISAVSVHPDARRRGLGALVTAAVASAAASRGQLAYLHVRDENERARALYQAMGFETVRSMTVTVVRQSR